MPRRRKHCRRPGRTPQCARRRKHTRGRLVRARACFSPTESSPGAVRRDCPRIANCNDQLARCSAPALQVLMPHTTSSCAPGLPSGGMFPTSDAVSSPPPLLRRRPSVAQDEAQAVPEAVSLTRQRQCGVVLLTFWGGPVYFLGWSFLLCGVASSQSRCASLAAMPSYCIAPEAATAKARRRSLE